MMYLMRGLPGSGKSTLARLLADKVDATVISSDEYFTVGGVYYFDVMKLGSAHRWTQWRARRLIEAGKNVILDNTNTCWKEVKCYCQLAVDFGHKVQIHEPDTLWAFDVAGLMAHGTHDVPEGTIESMLKRWEDSDSIFQKILKLKPKVKEEV